MASRTSSDHDSSRKVRPSGKRMQNTAARRQAPPVRSSRGQGSQQRQQHPAQAQDQRQTTRSPQRSASSSRRTARSAAPSKREPAYNAPSIWTNEAPRASSGGAVQRVFVTIGHILLGVLAFVGKGLVVFGRGFITLLSRSRALRVVCLIVLIVLAGSLVDFGLNAGKAYPGVRIGELDVAGKTTNEIVQLVNETYGARLAANDVVVYASEDARMRAQDEVAQAQNAALAEQLAVEEARANKLAWKADESSLQASVPAEQIAAEALAVGRGNGGLIARVGTLFAGNTIAPRVDYNNDALETMASDIDATIGEPRVDYDIAIEDGTATVTAGHDGNMIDRTWFKQSLDQVLLQEGGDNSFVVQNEYAPLRVDEAAAQSVANTVNQAIGGGASFTHEGSTWDATATDLGAWVATRVDERDEGSRLIAYLDESRAKPSLLSHMEEAKQSESIHVTFEVDGQNVTVHTDGTTKIPRAAEAVHQLNTLLFGEDGTTGAAPQATTLEITVGTGEAPAVLPFDEALDLGVVGTIATFTTEFTTGAGTENRNHNIKLASEFLNNSVVTPNNEWSFNGVAGDCSTEERGFQGAGAIVGGEYDDAIGGGICQVATTVFNAVYDAGFPVITRHNHSLYISSYPTGRDAAVSWPDLDLVWENDSSSDVLVRLSCVSGSLTVTLYGVNPGYQVSTTTGEWNEGEPYQTKTEVDESLAPGTSYLKTRGANGSSIAVVRTVKDRAGSIRHEDMFSSVYDPKTEVIVAGSDAVANTMG